MKRILLLFTLSLFIFTLGFSQSINHVDYGSNGLAIDLNEAYSMDINSDGNIDFYINSWDGELGFTPITGIGCFVSENLTDLTPWGSKTLQILDEGDIVQITDFNMWDYIDDDRGSNYKAGDGPAEGWGDAQAKYIGFAVFNSNNWNEVTNGWMRVQLDIENERLIILEYAYHDFTSMQSASSIEVGDRGFVNVQDLGDVLSGISVTPNPVQDILNVNYYYQGSEDIQITLYDNLGKVIYRKSGKNQSRLVYQTNNLTDGIYFVNFNTDLGVHTERVIISH